MAAQLTNPMKDALAKLRGVGGWQSAYDLRIQINTLDALVSRGFAKIKFGSGAREWPRSCIYYKAEQEE